VKKGIDVGQSSILVEDGYRRGMQSCLGRLFGFDVLLSNRKKKGEGRTGEEGEQEA